MLSQVICWAVPRYVLAIGERASMRRSLFLNWHPARRETTAGFILPVTSRPTIKSTDPQWLSRKSVGIKLEVEGKTNFVFTLNLIPLIVY